MPYLSRIVRTYLSFDGVLSRVIKTCRIKVRDVFYLQFPFLCHKTNLKNYLFSNLFYPSFSSKHTARSDKEGTLFYKPNCAFEINVVILLVVHDTSTLVIGDFCFLLAWGYMNWPRGLLSQEFKSGKGLKGAYYLYFLHVTVHFHAEIYCRLLEVPLSHEVQRAIVHG